MKQYLDLCRKALEHGMRKTNRTGVDHVGVLAEMCKYRMEDGFPAVTTKKLAFKSVVAEMLGFLRGYNNAADFRALGCKVWDSNANENTEWLSNEFRRGRDDLGRIYGVQARRWRGPSGEIDQLKKVMDDLSRGIDNRREIVMHWNPGELEQMALPACHAFYQFGIHGDELYLTLYSRSLDLPLGKPFNVAGYSWLLCVIAKITGLRPGTFTHMIHDAHIYVNQVDLMREQLMREPYPLPTLWINPEIKSLSDLETWVTPNDFRLEGYRHHEHIAYPFAV